MIAIWKQTVSSLVIGAAVGALIAWTYTTTNLNEKHAKAVGELNTAVETRNTTIGNLNTDIKALRQTITDNNTRIATDKKLYDDAVAESTAKINALKRENQLRDQRIADLVKVKTPVVNLDAMSKTEIVDELGDCRRAVEINNAYQNNF